MRLASFFNNTGLNEANLLLYFSRIFMPSFAGCSWSTHPFSPRFVGEAYNWWACRFSAGRGRSFDLNKGFVPPGHSFGFAIRYDRPPWGAQGKDCLSFVVENVLGPRLLSRWRGTRRTPYSRNSTLLYVGVTHTLLARLRRRNSTPLPPEPHAPLRAPLKVYAFLYYSVGSIAPICEVLPRP